MRLPVFLLLAVGVSLFVGGVSGFVGSSFWKSVGLAIATLVALQIGYFLFLILAARKVKKSKAPEKSD